MNKKVVLVGDEDGKWVELPPNTQDLTNTTLISDLNWWLEFGPRTFYEVGLSDGELQMVDKQELLDFLKEYQDGN